MTRRAHHSAGRGRGRVTHPQCPGQRWFPDLDHARDAATQLGGSRPTPCRRCGGFHLAIGTNGDPR